jgi:hypothetical protein
VQISLKANQYSLTDDYKLPKWSSTKRKSE